MPFVAPSDGCEGDGGYVAPDGVILGPARPLIELTAIVGTYLTLIVAIVRLLLYKRYEYDVRRPV
jgi:hypothetical protein